jgi:hypothetical protein
MMKMLGTPLATYYLPSASTNKQDEWITVYGVKQNVVLLVHDYLNLFSMTITLSSKVRQNRKRERERERKRKREARTPRKALRRKIMLF